MGFRDDVRRLKEAKEAQPEGLNRKERRERIKETLASEDRAEFESLLPEGFEAPYIDVVDTPGKIDPQDSTLAGWKPTAVEAYLSLVGLRPDDCFGIWPVRLGEGALHRVAIAYRDRPEYAEGRERFARWRETA